MIMLYVLVFVLVAITGDCPFCLNPGSPVIIRDNAGRIVTTVTPSVSGVQVIRDAQGRVRSTVTVRPGSPVIRDSSGRIGSGSLLPSKSVVPGKSGRGR